ncbi:hypothetical protein ACEVJK_01945 [Flintibacter sp. P01028]|uniref:hypothetical protein n=1 Tax=Flintibacter sp. P01028 TaxID=3342382 RepID=UPI0035B5FCCD
MEFNWSLFGALFGFGLIAAWKRDGFTWKDMRLWGERVTPKQSRENLIGLGVLGAILLTAVLFCLVD